MYELEKSNTLQEVNIIQTDDGYFRYINHVDKLATTGFVSKEKLLEYTNSIRFDAGTIELMTNRYSQLFS